MKEYQEDASSYSSFYDRQTAELTTLEIIIIIFLRIQCITISSLPAVHVQRAPYTRWLYI